MKPMTDDPASRLAFWNALAAGGKASVHKSLSKSDAAWVAARASHGDGFVYERFLLALDPSICKDDDFFYEELASRAERDMDEYITRMHTKWRAIGLHCEVTRHLPAALCYLWVDDDGLDMRSFLLAKLARILLQHKDMAWGHMSDAALTDALAKYGSFVTSGCREMSMYARARQGRRVLFGRRWESDGQRILVDGRHRHEIDGGFAGNLVELMLVRTEHNVTSSFWKLDSDFKYLSRKIVGWGIVEPHIQAPGARPWHVSAPPTICGDIADQFKLSLYSSNDDMDGCLPRAIARRLSMAGLDAMDKPETWWSPTRLRRVLSDCKASREAAAVLTDLRNAIARVLMQGDDKRIEKEIKKAYEKAVRRLDARPSSAARATCLPVEFADWMQERIKAALPDPGRTHTDLGSWITKEALDERVAKCDLPSSEAVRVRMLWMDLDAVVRSGASLDTRLEAIKDTLHAYRYDRPPWSRAQRVAARKLAEEAMRRL